MSRAFRGALGLLGALSLGLVATTFPVNTSRADDNKCTIAVKGDNEIVKACTAGGIKRAKIAMKSMQKIAKDKGMKVECDSCHKNETDWKLTDNGEKDFKKMLELVKS
jgi:hypothetical protein